MRRIPAPALLLPGEQCLYVSDGIQNPLRPMLILRVHDNNAKTVIMAFRAHTFGVIDMQVDIEGRGEFRRTVCQPVCHQSLVMHHTVDHPVDADAIQQQPTPDIGRGPTGRRVNPDTAALTTQLAGQ